MAGRQRIRDSPSSPAATCREETSGGCGGMGLSWPAPGHRCCPHRLLWPPRCSAGLPITPGSATPRDREGGWRCPCAPRTALSLTQEGAGRLPWQEHVVRAAGEMWDYRELVLSPLVLAAPSHQGPKRHQAQSPADVGHSRGCLTQRDTTAKAGQRRDRRIHRPWGGCARSPCSPCPPLVRLRCT